MKYIPLLFLAFVPFQAATTFGPPPPGAGLVCTYSLPIGSGVELGYFACPAPSSLSIGMPLTAKDSNGTAIFQAGTAVVCPSAIPGPGAAASSISCPANLYLPLQVVSSNGVNLVVADNTSIRGENPVAPFSNPPVKINPGYTVQNGAWVLSH